MQPNETTVPNREDHPDPPVVRDEHGERSILRPDRVIAGIELHGQHEIAEMTQRPGELDRFVERDESMNRRKADIRRGLRRTRRSLLDAHADLQQIER